MANTGAIYKNGVPYSEDNPMDIKVAASAMRAICDAKGNKIKDTYVKKAKQSLEFIDTAAYHNSVYRGKYLTTRFKSGDLYAEIASGKFRDIFIGDYFNISYDNPKKTGEKVNLTCRFAMFTDPITNFIYKPAAVIVPDQNIFGTVLTKWNQTQTVEGGYADSNILSEITSFVPTLTSIFGDSHVGIFSTRITNTIQDSMSGGGTGIQGITSADGSLLSKKIDLLSETEIFGTRILASGCYDNESIFMHLPLFRLNPELINIQVESQANCDNYLKSIVNNANVVAVEYKGLVVSSSPANSRAVRPKWIIW